MKHLIKSLAGLVAIVSVVGGPVAAPTMAVGRVALTPNQGLDHLLRGDAAPQWSVLGATSYFDPRPGPGNGMCQALACTDNSVCEINSCGPCGSEGSEDGPFPSRHCS